MTQDAPETSEIRDSLTILRMLCDFPSQLGKRDREAALSRATTAERAGWQFLADGEANPGDILSEIKAAILILYSARKRGVGRRLGAGASDKIERDALVLRAISEGRTYEAAIKSQYTTHFSAHHRRIKRKRKLMRELDRGQ